MTENDSEQAVRADVEAAALRILAGRPHATGELKRKLQRRDFPDDLIDAVCDWLTEIDYLDDQDFATRQAELLFGKSWGPMQIRNKLGNRGLDRDLVDRVVDELGDEWDWASSCRDRVVSKFGVAPADLEHDDKEKAFRHLKYRGYFGSTIRSVLFDGKGK